MEDSTKQVGPYRLIHKIGRGTMGVVYMAEDPHGGGHVALKVMAAEASGNQELVERFRREALSAAVLDHPNITQVYDFGHDGSQFYMAMELLEGSDLKHLIEAGAVADVGEKLAIMVQVSAGIGFVHARGLVHRDLKPGNIHVKSDGQVKIVDFGLVRVKDSEMTRTGMALGSPSYMSPEQVQGRKADARSDIFALGAVFYELLSGRRAFGGKGLAPILMAVVTGEPEPLSKCAPAVPGPVSWIAAKCLRKNPDERYQSGGELLAALEVAQLVYSRPA